MHAVGDRVRELDLDVDEAGGCQPVPYSETDSAPAMQPDVAPALGAIGGRQAVLGDDVGDPDPPAGPEHPGDSANTAALSGERLTTQFEMTTSTRLGGQRDRPRCRPSGTRRSWRRPRARCAARARASRRSCRGRRPCPSGPTRRAESSTSMPPPEPRSRTVSPSRSSATASGLPQPRLAATASSGSAARSSARVEALAEEGRRLLAATADALAVAPAATSRREVRRRLRVSLSYLLAHVRRHRRSFHRRTSMTIPIHR